MGREQVYELLTKNAGVYWTVSVIGRARIDKVNILNAAMDAMGIAVRSLGCSFRKVQVDGNHVPKQLSCFECEPVVGGDRKRFAIAAASIIAKVTRDRIMAKLDRKFPQYGFAAHKGYGTAAHQKALAKHGISKCHRRSFEPIKSYLKTGSWKLRLVHSK